MLHVPYCVEYKRRTMRSVIMALVVVFVLYASFRHWLTLWSTDLKKNRTVLADLYNYVQVDE